jgi:hypothetical protein
VASNKAEQTGAYRSMQILLLVFSVIFFFIIAYGYYNLFSKSGIFLALIAGCMMAIFAWFLARVIGMSPGGFRKYWVLFIPLMAISSAGVYNSFMLYLEGSQIMADTANDSIGQYGTLQKTAESTLAQSGATAKINKVRTISDALFSEIRNPVNCGQGPEAQRLIQDLQAELPGFKALSNPVKNCSKNEDVIADYRDRIGELVSRAPWNNPDLQDVVSSSTKSRSTLDELRSSVTTNYDPISLPRTLSSFEEQDANYRNLRFKLSRYTDVTSIDPGLHISEVQSLGNAFKLPALFLERTGRPATWAYLLIAVGFDILMVYLFELVASNRTNRRMRKDTIGSAWS